jgi:EAL domain-containing protein (putative c-di-GMP-specific phosphodiesterase class I)
MKRLIIENEQARLNALRDLNLLDTPPSEAYDRITRLAGRLLGAPVSTISLTDHDRQWFKSIVGASLVEIPRAEAPCTYAIHSDELFVVPDLLKDKRFNSGVMAHAGIRFYAGAPLITRSGYGLGTLCVMDGKPRLLEEDERQVLIDLAAMVMNQIELQNMIGLSDAVTGLPNEYRLFEDLEEDARQHPDATQIGVLVALLTPLQLNRGLRALGPAYAEDMVQGATQIIRQVVGENVRLYHVNGNRCVIILDEANGVPWQDLTRDLDLKLRETISCLGIPVMPDPVMGVYRYRPRDTSPREVLRRLFSATFNARQEGEAVAVYSQADDQAQARSFRLLSDMRAALETPGEMSLQYQPIIHLQSGRCAGAEALARWHHGEFGEVSPAEFILLAEGTAVIRPLTEWVLNEATAQTAAWQKSRQVSRVSINVSARNLEEPDLAERIGAAIARHKVDIDLVQLEFTESAFVSFTPRAHEQLAALSQMGLEIMIDDFGTGYNGLSYLRQLPVNAIKIDQLFIKGLGASERDQKLVRAMIVMAHDLGYRVVAEGVEDQAAYDLLAEWGCDEAQGYFISRPLSPAALTDWMAARRCA